MFVCPCIVESQRVQSISDGISGISSDGTSTVGHAPQIGRGSSSGNDSGVRLFGIESTFAVIESAWESLGCIGETYSL
jgi:hypothetical protein